MHGLSDDWTVADIEAVLAGQDADAIARALILVAMDPPDCDWAAEICLGLADHPLPRVRANALLGLGHLARTCDDLNPGRVRPVIEAGLRDPDSDVAGHARTAADELRVFLGWIFAEV
ncbi:MAG: hypothetical protein Q8K93_09125 [Reyranella sp.]|nr:hypothetical protein [Reyranella sp.]